MGGSIGPEQVAALRRNRWQLCSGIRKQKTPEAFRNACHRFVFTEVLRPQTPAPGAGTQEPPRSSEQSGQRVPEPSVVTLVNPPFPREFLIAALEKSADESGWSHLGTFGSYLQKIQPDFDSRLHGYKKLSDLVRAHPELFITEERPAPGSNYKVLYVKGRTRV